MIDNNNHNTDTFYAIEINIRNSKMRNTGHSAYTMIGRSGHKLDPALLLFDLYHSMDILAHAYPNAYNWNNNSFLFQNGKCGPLTTDNYRELYKKLIHSIGYLDANRLELPHSARKGFASQLSRCGVSAGKIAFAGRWYLPQSLYIYITFQKHELVTLAYSYFRNEATHKGLTYDFDKAEANHMIKQFKSDPKLLLNTYL